MIKIQDGDLYKILPIIGIDGKISPCISVDCIYLPQSSVTLYEQDGKILPKIFRQNPKLQGKKHFISVLHQGKVDWVSVGRTLFNKLIQEPNSIDQGVCAIGQHSLIIKYKTLVLVPMGL